MVGTEFCDSCDLAGATPWWVAGNGVDRGATCIADFWKGGDPNSIYATDYMTPFAYTDSWEIGGKGLGIWATGDLVSSWNISSQCLPNRN